MFLQVNVSQIITTLYQQLGRNNPKFRARLLDDGHYVGLGMAFSVLIRASLNDVTAHRFMHFILAGHAVHVWCVESTELSPFGVPRSEWINTSNHDSCWRSDGVASPLDKLYFHLCDEVQADVPEEDKVAPANITVKANFGSVAIFNYVRVQFVPTKDYRYEIIDIEDAREGREKG